jgi:hypothetical protein
VGWDFLSFYWNLLHVLVFVEAEALVRKGKEFRFNALKYKNKIDGLQKRSLSKEMSLQVTYMYSLTFRTENFEFPQQRYPMQLPAT